MGYIYHVKLEYWSDGVLGYWFRISGKQQKRLTPKLSLS
jgi:hypothetical protein